jgi:hypothetical protein
MKTQPEWMSLDNMRSNGVSDISLWCHCGRHVVVNVDHMPGHWKVPALRERYRCSPCKLRPQLSRPEWHDTGSRPAWSEAGATIAGHRFGFDSAAMMIGAAL